MNISNVLAGATDLAGIVNRVNPLATGTGAPAAPTNPEVAKSNASSAALREILAKYDINNISPDQFSQMIQKLSDAGIISKKETQDLAGVRADLDKAGVEPDESINLLDFYRQQIKRARREFDNNPNATVQQQVLRPMAQRLDWLEKFSTLQAHPESASVSALA